ncbi:MAG: type II toxin-antitoxin system VapC family toxin [Acidobacteria bacterium]|nr:type II toxin-antitoxin system VapC family toxin [Acidobacteriota bacterium]
MTLYLDTSAFVKLLVAEEHSETVFQLVEDSTLVITCRISFVEAASALSRYTRAKLLDAGGHARAQKALIKHWNGVVSLDVDEKKAADLTRKHDLRAADAIHLAAVLDLRRRSKDIALQFCSFDTRQRTAALSEGLVVVPKELN